MFKSLPLLNCNFKYNKSENLVLKNLLDNKYISGAKGLFKYSSGNKFEGECQKVPEDRRWAKDGNNIYF